jgi:hypothetical protein
MCQFYLNISFSARSNAVHAAEFHQRISRADSDASSTPPFLNNLSRPTTKHPHETQKDAHSAVIPSRSAVIRRENPSLEEMHY